MAVFLAALTAAAAIWCLRSPLHRPPLSGLLAAAPVALLVLVPFLAAGRAGILGATVDNDMASHLLFAEYIVSAATAAAPLPSDYPLGPHDLAAVLSHPGPRLPIGRVTARRSRRLTISFGLEAPFMAPASATASITRVVATPTSGSDRIVPIRRACGEYVDWYRGGRHAPSGPAAG